MNIILLTSGGGGGELRQGRRRNVYPPLPYCQAEEVPCDFSHVLIPDHKEFHCLKWIYPMTKYTTKFSFKDITYIHTIKASHLISQ